MSTSLPTSMSFEMLSRLPPASFVLEYREMRPDIEPAGGVYPVNTTSQVDFHLRAATNEFALNTNIPLCGDVAMSVDYSAVALAADLLPEEVRAVVCNDENEITNLKWRSGPTWIDSSRESFNSGSLPFLDNQDSSLHLAYNNLRCQLAKRDNVPIRNREGQFGIISDRGTFQYDIRDLAGAGWNSAAGYKGLNIYYQNATGAPDQYRKVDNGVCNFQIPLGMYSNLINTASVVPLGLCSAYSVNGYSVRVRLANLVNSIGGDDPVVEYTGVNTRPVGLRNGVKASREGDGYRNLRIYVPIIRVLDPAVMTAVLSLYEKRQNVSVGNVSFPMSLRINSLGYRTYNYPLNATQGDYYWRLPCTDRSVRAVAWKLINTNDNLRDVTTLFGGNGTPVNTRLETRVGSLRPHPVIEDQTPYDRNIVKFYGLNKRRSAHCFSPLPYYQESIKHSGHQSDLYDLVNWADRSGNHSNSQYGVISFENLDYREQEFSGSFQASGIDLTGVGGIDINMRFNHYEGDADGVPNGAGAAPFKLTVGQVATGVKTTFENGAASGTGPGPAGSWTIIWLLAYDAVHEISPSGVIDITNSIL